MKILIEPSEIKGSVQAPPSKSAMQRALAAALLHKGKTVIQNAGHSDDDKAALQVIQNLGAGVCIHKNEIAIQSEGFPQGVAAGQKIKLHCGESGLSLRLFAAITALHHEEIILDGEGSLQKRPIQFIEDALTALGVKLKTNQGHLPITMQGPMSVKSLEADGAVSSQFLSGLLMAFAAAGAQDVSIHVKDLKSKPYIDFTIDVMKHFGMPVPGNKNYETFVFNESENRASYTKEIHYTVEGDWSGCAFMLVAGAIAGPVTIRGLDVTSAQADKKIIDALMEANAAIAVEAKGIKIHPSGLQAFHFDATDCPDLFPPLVVLAAYCKGESTIKGVNRLYHKESNRGKTLQQEFAKMGVKISLEDDEMKIFGTGLVKGVVIDSHNDHRIAMAAAVAGLKANAGMTILHAEVVNKSYPGFYYDLKNLGATVSLPVIPIRGEAKN